MTSVLLGGFVGMMSLGVPLAVVIIGAGTLYIMFATDVPLSIVAQRLFAGMDDFTLMAIPLFVVAGFLMNEVGLTERLVTLAKLAVRRPVDAWPLLATMKVPTLVINGEFDHSMKETAFGLN